MVGTTVSHYRIISRIGAGGMGVVFLSEDERLHRKVALKFLPPEVARDSDARIRLLHEAQAASALDHPNVAAVIDIEEYGDQLFIAMPYYEGETLRDRISRNPLSIEEAARIAGQIASGLAAAHAAGIIHRDLKPANVMLTRTGQVKILDFGLAKVYSVTDQTMARVTQTGTTVGTVAYMAPEQSMGRDVDGRADVWALGVTFFEMLTGGLPFRGQTVTEILLAVASGAPIRIRDVRPDVPETLSKLIERALEKDPTRRETAEDFANGVAEWLARQSAGALQIARPSVARRPLFLTAFVVLGVGISVAAGWFVRQRTRERWAREQALPQIEQLAEREEYVAAFQLAQQAKHIIPTDPIWKRIDPIVSRTLTVKASPQDVSVSYRPVGSNGPWIQLGAAPIANVTIPKGYLEWRFEKPGYVMGTDATASLFAPTLTLLVTLHPLDQTPPGMVYVTAGDKPQDAMIAGLEHLPAQRLRDFWIDRYEVTNRDFKRFVDAGGYRVADYWRYPFLDGDRPLSFGQAMARFVDSTGRPGPATWESGTFLEGQEDFPVTGVSWYEAAAYALFAGKALPTIFHWSRVAEQGMSGVIVPRSNFSGRGPMKVGASGGMNRFGAFDLAGNVKEWCWNLAGPTKRYILGGAWDDPVYMFNDADARAPLQRAPDFGFRCVKYSPDDAVAKQDELIAFDERDFRKEKPASDEVFAAYRKLYDYDHDALDARVDSDDSSPDWRLEKASFTAAYANERMRALVYVPKTHQSSHQTVVFFPGSAAIARQTTPPLEPLRSFDWLIKSGRTFVYPIYKSTYDRSDEITTDIPNMTNTFRDHVIMWAKDVSRSIDYLETRPDIDRNCLAFYGYSWGAGMAPIFLAVEPRFKAAVLSAAGYYSQRSASEVEAINFVSHVKIPVLMLNGRYDFFAPEATTVTPFFDLLGTPDKRIIWYDTSHNIPRPELIRETLGWLDKYCGPVQ